jgi:asparagine synthase (glutamine-hydrolysing)
MCGFNGVIGDLDSKILNLVKEESHKINHRGPDEKTYLEKENIYVDFFRLSIVDIDQGSQPKSDQSGRMTILFNGEIYNFKKLRKILQDEGINFNSNSDTEVLLNVLSHFGLNGLKMLNGMFAICLIDNQSNKTYLIRDQFGIKPLYYSITENYIKFSSEVKTLINKNTYLSESSLGQYLNYQFYLSKETLCQDVFQVEPGCYLEIDNKSLEVKKLNYFELEFLNDKISATNLDNLEKAICESVKLQTYADVSVGTHLSGGIDSSLITAIASNYKKNLKAFHGYFPEDSNEFSEIEYARKVAEYLNIELYEIPIYSEDFITHFPKIMSVLDYPIVGPGVFPQYMVNDFASKHVKVLLGGQGGDEIFAGYARYLIVYLEQLLHGVINGSHDEKHLVSLETVSKALPSLKEYIPLIKKMWSDDLFTEPAKRYEKVLNRHIPESWLTEHTKQLSKKSEEVFMEKINSINEKSLINKMLHFDTKYILPGLLHVEDRVSMIHSIESRVPYLDQKVFECAVNLEPSLKFGEGVLKNPLKLISQNYLPEKVSKRKTKMGFPVPLNSWLKDESFKNFVFETILTSNFANSIYFNKEQFEKDSLNFDNFDRSLWAVLCLSEWSKKIKF